MDYEFAMPAVEKNRMLGTAIQRYDPSGKILADPDFKHGLQQRMLYRKTPEKMDPKIKKDFDDWENSEWYVGLSLTRNKKFAAAWKDVIFELDYRKLSSRFKIIPWNWGSSGKNYKKEFEEFLVLNKFGKKYVDAKTFLNPTDENTSSLKPLHKYLSGIYISKEKYNIIPKTELEFLTTHPLYKGTI